MLTDPASVRSAAVWRARSDGSEEKVSTAWVQTSAMRARNGWSKSDPSGNIASATATSAADSAPALFVGLRQASASAWLTLIVAEQVNASQGLGFMINSARDFYRTHVVIFGLIIYATLGLLTDALIRRWEQHVFRYRVH